MKLSMMKMAAIKTAAAMGLMMLGQAALADVSLYGQAHVSVDGARNGDLTAGNKDSALMVSSNRSRIGFKGVEVLSDALSFEWQFETEMDLDNGGWGAGRDSFVGLRGGFGRVLAGRHRTPLRIMTDSLDIFADTRADFNAVVGNMGGDAGAPTSGTVFDFRADNILMYQSPADNAYQFSVAYVSNYTDDELPVTTVDAEQTATSMALRYTRGALYMGVGYERLNDFSGFDTLAADVTRLVVQWNFDQGTQASLIWEDARADVVERTAIYMNISHISGNMTYKAALGQIDDAKGFVDSGALHTAVGVDWAQSPNTELYLLYSATRNDAGHRYGLDGVAVIANGDDASVVSVGLRHRFGLDW